MKLPQPMSAGQIAAVIGGQVKGDAEHRVSGVAVNPFAATTDDVALATDRAVLKRLEDCKAGILITPNDTGSESEKQVLIWVERPKLAIQKICTFLAPPRFYPEPGIHDTAVVDPSAEVASDAAIGPNVVIGPGSKIGSKTIVMANTVIGGKVTIGADCLIHPGCLIADYVIIGNRVILQQGANLGADGFGYVTRTMSNAEHLYKGRRSELSDEPNPHLKIPHIGTVILEDDVEIGACTTIDRATIGATIIGAGTKIDNLVLIAHNCVFGKESIVVGHTAVGGSCMVGDRTIMAGGARITDHMKIGKDAIIEGCAAVIKDVPEAEIQVGIPATPAREQLRLQKLFRNLPELVAETRELKERISKLEERLLNSPVK